MGKEQTEYVQRRRALSQRALDQEHDGCAIIASIRTSGEATHGNLKRTIEALGTMGHRSGDVQSEGDGCGVLTDIPRVLWTQALQQAGRPTWLADDKRFFVGHLMIPHTERQHLQTWQSRVLRLFANQGADMLLERPGATRQQALGRLALSQEPYFWQVAGVLSQTQPDQVEAALFEIAHAIEWQSPVHVASLSSHSVVYKVRGSVETLYHYYPELRSRDFTTAITIGHARYSTNTSTVFERVQPFTLLGHNGEINTIARLREQARMLGAELVDGASDSQDVNKVLEMLMHRFGFSLIEAMELVFPPILSEVDKFSEELQTLHRYYRRAFGPYSQGPAAIVARHGDTCIGSVDALGLRPLWFGQTEKECFFSSEKGVVPMDLLNGDPKPLSPGEKIAVQVKRNEGADILPYPKVQEHLLERAKARLRSLAAITPALAWNTAKDAPKVETAPDISDQTLTAFSWSRDDKQWAEDVGDLGKDPVASTGFDGPLAALAPAYPAGPLQNLSDYFKEKVAVVTNPAIDREREKEHFSTQSIVGSRPALNPAGRGGGPCLVLDNPVLAGGHGEAGLLDDAAYRVVATASNSMRYEDLLATFPRGTVAVFSLSTRPKESVNSAAKRLVKGALRAIEAGARVLVLDDQQAFRPDENDMGNQGWIPPHLAVAMVDEALREAPAVSVVEVGDMTLHERAGGAKTNESMRRQVGIVLRSAAFRNLHDLIVALGLGADALVPYKLVEVAVGDTSQMDDDAIKQRLGNTLKGLRIGLEKVTSTMGIHELRGYGRIFASIGLSNPLVEVMDAPNYAGGAGRGVTWDDLDRDNELRLRIFNDPEAKLPRIPRAYPPLARTLRQIAQDVTGGEEGFATMREMELQQPVAIRHTLGFNAPASAAKVPPAQVDASITGHDWPFVIASMSFGSQGETAFRAYAEAAKQLNIITLNGEGGEIEDMMGQYPMNRGQQIASGRFGINIKLLNASNILELKIGQGAKPGEGGHLPGRKVSAKVARARHVSPGVDLISPSNHHDIYSIEDLAQFVEELKTANPKARVAVKLPVVPDIGVIAVGVAKAGADIITVTGYEGGTGAARAHSLRNVGLPAELGLMQAHRALLSSGMRKRVELWADGGVRSPDDAVKLMCLGANRVGFGTLPMLALGCVLCRRCQFGECQMGITTQIESEEEAKARGLKRFQPLHFETGVEQLVRLFSTFGEEVKRLCADLGVQRLQDLVGRADLLEQISHYQQLNLQALLTPASDLIDQTPRTGMLPLRRPRNHLTTVVSNLVMEAVASGEKDVAFEDDRVTPVDRALGTHLAGALTRYQQGWDWLPGHNGVGGQQETWRRPVNGDAEHINNDVKEVYLGFYNSTVPGNGLGAYSTAPITIFVEGGAQDGVGKGLGGGRVVVLKGYNHDGVRIDGSVGKGLGYGATGGVIVVQGNADSRACVRLSGADVIIGGEITEPLQDELGFIGTRANVKGFLCEYMTAGRVMVLGDPGPWICAGMTGGILYLRLQPAVGFDKHAIRRRIAQGANVKLQLVEPEDSLNVQELINAYTTDLMRNHQRDEAAKIIALLDNWQHEFVKIVPER